MGESKHTPGPWEAHFWDILDNSTLKPTGKKRMTIEYRVFPDVSVGRALAELCFENEANAHLIAAAPDLLEALQEWVVAFGPVEVPNTQGAALLAKSRAAIERASERSEQRRAGLPHSRYADEGEQA